MKSIQFILAFLAMAMVADAYAPVMIFDKFLKKAAPPPPPPPPVVSFHVHTTPSPPPRSVLDARREKGDRVGGSPNRGAPL